MEAPGPGLDPDGHAGANLTYLVTHETGHQWFYGIVGNDQAREPFADEAATDFVARHVLGLRRGSRCARTTRPLDLPLPDDLLLRGRVHPGRQFAGPRAGAHGCEAVLARARGYLADHRWGLSHTRTLLDALDAATPLNLRPTWRSRFPSLY